MDFATFYGLVTLAGLICFVGLVAWVFSESTRLPFQQAALIPFQEKDLPSPYRGSWSRHY